MNPVRNEASIGSRRSGRRYSSDASEPLWLLCGMLTDPTINTANAKACNNHWVSPPSNDRLVATAANNSVPKNKPLATDARLPRATLPVTINTIPKIGSEQTSKPGTTIANAVILGFLSDEFSKKDSRFPSIAIFHLLQNGANLKTPIDRGHAALCTAWAIWLMHPHICCADVPCDA
jgi:hypothetical protein